MTDVVGGVNMAGEEVGDGGDVVAGVVGSETVGAGCGRVHGSCVWGWCGWWSGGWSSCQRGGVK